MILCVYEGARENKWFQFVNRHFLKNKVVEYFIVEGTFQRLYNALIENEWDTLEALRDIESNRPKKEQRLLKYQESDFSEVYLFFDYDPHSQQSVNHLNENLAKMLEYFDNETEHGKMYVNYPMIEAIRYTKLLPDSDFYSYTENLEECGNFKQMAAKFSGYTSNNFFDGHGNSDSKTIENWQLLKNQNVAKANYICRGENIMPTSKEGIAQTLIFKSQLAKYICTDIPRVAILSAYPIFLFDYLKVSM